MDDFRTVAPRSRASLLAPRLLDGRDRFDGRVITPADSGWDEARTPWQLAVDQRPAAVVLAASEHDVIATVRAARACFLRVAAQATGHNANPLGPLDDTVLLRTSGMRGVEIDVRRRVARVQAGAVWGDVSAAAAEVGLAALAGSARDVGVVGYTLGGGLSWFARSHGLAANHVVAADIVTADGGLRRVDEDHDRDLFWAIRGGGGSFGIVTALEFRLFPITRVTAGALFWPIERASEVLHAWREWLPAVPDEITTVGRLMRFPPLPEVPEPVRGRSFVIVELASQLDEEATDGHLVPLWKLDPEIETVKRVPVTELADLHMDPPGPVPATGDGVQLADLSAEALDAYLAVTTAPDFTMVSTELRQLGGALTTGRVRGGAVSGLDGAVGVFSVDLTPDRDSAAAAGAALDRLHAALAPWAADSTYLNFAERRPAPPVFPAQEYQHLREVKTAVDPDDVIRANHPVPPLTRLW
jgi:FAD binding domain